MRTCCRRDADAIGSKNRVRSCKYLADTDECICVTGRKIKRIIHVRALMNHEHDTYIMYIKDYTQNLYINQYFHRVAYVRLLYTGRIETRRNGKVPRGYRLKCQFTRTMRRIIILILKTTINHCIRKIRLREATIMYYN